MKPTGGIQERLLWYLGPGGHVGDSTVEGAAGRRPRWKRQEMGVGWGDRKAEQGQVLGSVVKLQAGTPTSYTKLQAWLLLMHTQGGST